MHEGAGAGLVLNRFYYQLTIPIKDAAILANMPFAYGVGHRKD